MSKHLNLSQNQSQSLKLKIRVTGKSVDEAIKEALKELDVPKERLSYEVLEEPRKGFLGFGAKKALLEAAAIPDPIEVAHSFLTKTVSEMGIDASIEQKNTSEGCLLSIQCAEERDAARLIGKRGQTLDSLEYLVELAANRHKVKYQAFQVDVGDYRSKRYELLRELAHRVASKAANQEEGIPLEPMNARDRKIVHQILYKKKGVTTVSKGKGTNRHVIVKKSND